MNKASIKEIKSSHPNNAFHYFRIILRIRQRRLTVICSHDLRYLVELNSLLGWRGRSPGRRREDESITTAPHGSLSFHMKRQFWRRNPDPADSFPVNETFLSLALTSMPTQIYWQSFQRSRLSSARTSRQVGDGWWRNCGASEGSLSAKVTTCMDGEVGVVNKKPCHPFKPSLRLKLFAEHLILRDFSNSVILEFQITAA